MAHRHYGALPPKPKKPEVECWHVHEYGYVTQSRLRALHLLDKRGSGYYSSEVVARRKALALCESRLERAQAAHAEAVQLLAEAEARAASGGAATTGDET